MKQVKLSKIKGFRLLALLLCLAASVPQLWAQTYTVAGTSNGFLQNQNWAQNYAGNDMTKDPNSSYYYLARTANVNQSNDYAFKIVKNHDWSTAYPGSDYGYSVSSTGQWSIVYLFDTNNNSVSLFGPFKTLTVAGDQTEILGSSWGQNDANNDMTSSDGINYTLSFTDVDVTAGNYLFKVNQDHAWTYAWPSSNKEYYVGFTGKADVTFSFNVISKNVDVTVTEKSVTPTIPNYYITGDNGLGLGGFSYQQQNLRTMAYDDVNDIYTYNYNVTALGTYYFTFADGGGSTWDDFNGNHRYGPSSGNETVNLGNWAPTQKGSGSYAVTLDAGQVTITLDVANMRYKVDGTAPTIVKDYYVKGDSTSIFPDAWNTGLTNTQMADPDEDGVYTWTSGQFHLIQNTNYKYRVYCSDGTWYPSSGNQTFSADVPGTYTVTVTYDSNNGTVNAVPNLVQADPTYTYTFYVLPDDGSVTPTLYLWGTNNNNYHPLGDWAGTAMNDTEVLDDGNTWYKWTGALYANLMNAIVNNGGNGHQTTDITSLAPDTYYIRWNVNDNTFTITTDAPEPAPTYDYTIYVRYKGDGTPYMYLWNGSDELLGAFPGTALTDAAFSTESINGYTYYKYTLTGSSYASLSLIFDEGDNTAQTQSLAMAPGTSYFTYGGGNTISGPNAAADPAIVYYAESDFNGWTTEGTQMTPNGDDSYSKTFTGLTLSRGEYGYKAYGNDGTNEGVWIGDSNGDNAIVNVPMSGTYTVTITLNSDGTLSHTLTMTAPATVYITGDGVLGGFSCDQGIAMVYEGDGIYSYATTLTDKATTQFVFADGQNADWTVFNSTYRIGPDNGDEVYTINSGYTATQKAGGDNGSYSVVAGAGAMTFYFDAVNMQYKVEGAVPPTIYYVVGNDEDLFGAVWTQNEAGQMTYDSQSGTYTWTTSNVHLTRDGEYSFKVNGDDGSWRPADNIDLDVQYDGTYTLTVTFDGTNVNYDLTLIQADDMGAYYIVGSDGLGLGWTYAPTTAMTFDPTTGVYSYTVNVTEQGTYGFVFANNNTAPDWDIFNSQYRFGPTSGNQNVSLNGDWQSTQLAGGNDGGAYQIHVAPGTVTIYFDPANMLFKVAGDLPYYEYTFYILPDDPSVTPYIYVWEGNTIALTDAYPGTALGADCIETLHDGNNWYRWSGVSSVDLVGAIVSGGGDGSKTKDITNISPGTYYIKWKTVRDDDEEFNYYELYNVEPSPVADNLYMHGTYIIGTTEYNYSSSNAAQLKYDSNTATYYLNNVILSNNATFCFSTALGDDWSHVGTRYGNGGADGYTVNDGGTNYLGFTDVMANHNLSLGLWSDTYGEYRMLTAGVYNVLVNPTEHWVKLIKTDHSMLSPMNVYLEQTENVGISNIQNPGTTYTHEMFGGDVWPLSAYNRQNGTWSNTNFYNVDYLGDTITADGKKWWHWQVHASICDLFFTRDNKTPNQSDTIQRHSGLLWVTWDESNGTSVMTDHTREYFDYSANALPTNAVVMEGHYYAYFINTVGWENVYCYAWDDNSSSHYHDGYGRDVQDWPGRPCECVGIDPVTGYEVWRYDFGILIDAHGYAMNPPDNVIFNDGNPNEFDETKEQTGDFMFVNGGVFDYLGLFDGAYTLNNLIRNAAEEVRYTVSNDLLAVYYDRDAVTPIEITGISGKPDTIYVTGALYAKDLNLYGEKSIKPDSTYTDYVYDICYSSHTAGRSQIMDKKTSYDQSNWVKLVMSPNYDGGAALPVEESQRPALADYVGHIIPAGTLDVFMTDTINPTAHVLKIGMGRAMSYEPNVYVSANFNDTIVFNYAHPEWQPDSYEGTYRTKPSIEWITDPETGDVLYGNVTRTKVEDEPYKMYYVAPKPQEIAYITWIVYDNLNEINPSSGIRPYGDYVSGEYRPFTSAAMELPVDPGRFYAPMNWDRSIVIPGDKYNELQYLSADQLDNALGGYGQEYGPYSNGYMQYGGVKVNWSLFDMDAVGMAWWQIFQPGQAYKLKAIIRYARGNGEGYQPNECYGPGNGDEGDNDKVNVKNAPRRDGNGQGNYANMYFTRDYKDLDDSKFIIFPIEASPAGSNGSSMGNVTTVEEVSTARTIVNVRYYNMMGVESSKPFDGFNIIVTTYSDGSRSSRKVLR